MGAVTGSEFDEDGPQIAVIEGFHEWIDVGIRAGWISAPVCSMHDGLPLALDEEAEIDEGYDPCLPAVRLWGPDGPPPLAG